MSTLLISTRSLPAAPALLEAAKAAGWQTRVYDERPRDAVRGKVICYSGTDLAPEIMSRFALALLEPPLDLLARLPAEFRQRRVEFACFADLARLKSPAFVKPANALNKVFDAGIYAETPRVRGPRKVDPATPVLVADSVEWLAEFRCFILNEEIVAWSPYLSFGRPVWKPHPSGETSPKPPSNVAAFCERLFRRAGIAFPPAFVMDVGLIEERGWGVVEFNPVWCSGLLGADARGVLPALERASQRAGQIEDADRAWVITR